MKSYVQVSYQKDLWTEGKRQNRWYGCRDLLQILPQSNVILEEKFGDEPLALKISSKYAQKRSNKQIYDLTQKLKTLKQYGICLI